MGEVSLDGLLDHFAKLDPKGKQLLGLDKFNQLSTELGLSGENVTTGTTFGGGVMTFSELCTVANASIPELPVSINPVAEAFRRLDSGGSGKVQFMNFAKKMGYLYDAQINPEDVEVTFGEALQRISGPKQDYKLNIFKDIFRKFGRDGDGTLSKEEMVLAMRFLGLDLSSDLERITMHDLIKLVITDPEHPIMVLQIDMNETRKAFDWCDMDHNGVLDSGELAKALRLAGQNPSQADFKRLRAEFDQDKDGVFDFHEFTGVISRSFVSKDDMRRKALEAFSVFDTDNSGFISLDELRRIMTTFGEDMSDDEVSELFAELDTNDDGKLEIAEFVELLIH